MVVSWNRSTPSYHPRLDGILHCKLSIWGFPHLWKTPYNVSYNICDRRDIYIIGQKHKFKIVKIWTDTDLRVWCCTLSWCQKGSSRTCCGSHMGIMYLGGQVVKYCYRRRHLDSQDAAISWQIVSYDGHDGWESSPLGLKSRLGTPLSICTDPWMLQCWSPR